MHFNSLLSYSDYNKFYIIYNDLCAFTDFGHVFLAYLLVTIDLVWPRSLSVYGLFS